MRVIVTGMSGESVGRTVKQRLHQLLSSKLTSSGKVMRDSIVQTTRRHFTSRYPGSAFWSPSKVLPGEAAGARATVDVDVPGASRAYHDVVIVPKLRKKLTIPFANAAGTKASDYKGLFAVTTKDGSSFLAQRSASGLVMLFVLVDKVFQRRDPGLMPSDSTYAGNIFDALKVLLDK